MPVAFFSRHARGHRYGPTDINYRANICGFKILGCDAILSVSAVGSLKEEYAPRHAVVPDQFIDRTRHRPDTFFGEGIVAHVAFADPVCPALSAVLETSARHCGLTVHGGGTYVCMEGPQFSTRAEARLYRGWGADVVGMTNLTEAKLAREAEICYASLALVTDYDCWREATDAVSVETILDDPRGERGRRAAQPSGSRPPRGSLPGLLLPRRAAPRHPDRPEGHSGGGEGDGSARSAGRYL